MTVPKACRTISSMLLCSIGKEMCGLERRSGVVKFDGSTWSVYERDNSGLPSNIIDAIAID